MSISGSVRNIQMVVVVLKLKTVKGQSRCCDSLNLSTAFNENTRPKKTITTNFGAKKLLVL